MIVHGRIPILLIGLWIAFAPPAAGQAQRGDDRKGTALRMGDTAIMGERPTPDIFFIVPTGKGGNLSAPHRRDYSSEILAPVVKPWLEKDQNVRLAALEHVSRDSGDWKEALKAVPVARAAPPPEVVRPSGPAPIGIPEAARSGGPPPVSGLPASPPPPIPPAARSYPPPPSMPSAAPSYPASPPPAIPSAARSYPASPPPAIPSAARSYPAAPPPPAAQPPPAFMKTEEGVPILVPPQ